MLAVKFESPEYLASTRYVPTFNELMVRLAWPLARVTVPKTLDPCWKVTVPVGAPPYSPATVAVNVKGCPKRDGFCEDVRVVVVFALVTC